MELNDDLKICFAGDVMPDTTVRLPAVIFQQREFTASQSFHRPPPLTFINSIENREWLSRRRVDLSGAVTTAHGFTSREVGALNHVQPVAPLDKLADSFSIADLVCCNLECPLSYRGRRTKIDMFYRADPSWAERLKQSNISIVSFSNNHVMDYGEQAFLDTLDSLDSAGIVSVGATRSHVISERSSIVTAKGVRVAFCGYCSVGPEYTFAAPGESGIFPLNPCIANEDIDSVEGRADLRVASVHWGGENESAPRGDQIAMAHDLIDIGFDIVYGHHSHVPGAIEIYRGKPILYSLGNLAFGHGHDYWGDNHIIDIDIVGGEVDTVNLTPLDTSGINVFCPERLLGERAAKYLARIKQMSGVLGCDMVVDERNYTAQIRCRGK